MNTPKRPAVNRINTVIDCGDAQIMAEFYSRLLGWELTLPAANGWAAVTSPEGESVPTPEACCKILP